MNRGGLSDSRGPVAFGILRCRLGPRRRTRLVLFAVVTILALLSSRSTAQTVRGTWKRLGPDGGQVLSLASSRDGVLYLGTPDGHVFASTDAAHHWELRGRVSPRLDAVVQHLLVDARSPQRLFAAVWFQDPAAGGGIFRSEDAGHAWTLVGLAGEAVRALEQSASQPEFLAAGTRSGVFRSADGGQSWERISPSGDPELRNVDSLAFDPRESRTIYVGTYHLPWKTVDSGKTWALVSAGMIDDSDVMALRVDARDAARLFASACSGIYRTDNGGKQWTKLEGVPYAARRTQDIVQDPADPRVLYAGTTEGLWITRDSGERWTRATPREWVINAIAALPGGAGLPSRLILGTEDGGIQVSDDGGFHFAASNEGLTHRLVIAFAAAPDERGHWLARFGPVDTWMETRDAGRSWQDFPALPSHEDALIFGSSVGWFAAPEEGGLFRYDDTTRQWRALRLARPSARRSRLSVPRSTGDKGKDSLVVALRPPAVHDLKVAANRLWIATSEGIWLGEALAPALNPLAGPSTSNALSLDIESSGTASRLWVVGSAGLLAFSTTGQPLSKEQLPLDAGELRWVRTVNAGGNSGLLVGALHGVYRRANGTAAWRLLATGLPETELSLLFLSDASCLVASKTGGLYLSLDAGGSWSRLDRPSETSRFLAGTADSASFVVASRTEGLLEWATASTR